MPPIKWFKLQAKRLHQAYKADNPDAQKRVESVLRDLDGNVGLVRAQHVVAVEAGFKNWKALIHASEEEQERAVKSLAQGAPSADNHSNDSIVRATRRGFSLSPKKFDAAAKAAVKAGRVRLDPRGRIKPDDAHIERVMDGFEKIYMVVSDDHRVEAVRIARADTLAAAVDDWFSDRISENAGHTTEVPSDGHTDEQRPAGLQAISARSLLLRRMAERWIREQPDMEIVPEPEDFERADRTGIAKSKAERYQVALFHAVTRMADEAKE